MKNTLMNIGKVAVENATKAVFAGAGALVGIGLHTAAKAIFKKEDNDEDFTDEVEAEGTEEVSEETTEA